MIGIGINTTLRGSNATVVPLPVATAATGVGSTSFTANWNAYTGATYYLLDVSTSSSFTTFVYENQITTSTSYVVIGLQPNTTYYYRVRASTEGDADALSFVSRIYTAGGTISYTEFQAVNSLVSQMKADGIWTKMKAIYPFVGGGTGTTAQRTAACSQNLKSSSFTGTFTATGWTFASTGVTPNGTSAYINSNFNPFAQSVNKNNFGISFYSRTNSSGNYVDIGVVDGSSYIALRVRNSGTDYIGVYDDSNFSGNYLTNSIGLLTVQRDSLTTQKFYQGSVLKAERTGFNATADINLNIYLSARNLFNGTPGTFSNRECAFAAIHEAFNSTEISNYSSAVQAFQTTLSRNV